MTTDAAPRRRPRHLILARRLAAAAVLVVIGVLCGPPGAAAPTPGWTSPLEPLVVVHGFDPPAGPYAPGHRGVDLAGNAGQPVRAAAGGVVSYAGRIAGVGVVAVVHGRIRTTYQPLEVGTTRGAAVAAGDELGRLGVASSHCAPDPCLHWGAIIGDTYVDPLKLLNPGPSRLLPYWDATEHPAAGDPPAAGARLAQGLVTAAGASPPLTSRTGDPAVSLLVAEPSATEDRAHEEARPRATAQETRTLPGAVVAAVTILGGGLAAVALLAVRRRSR